MPLHVLEKLAATHPDCEIWWDSSPLVYADWKARTLASAPPDKRAEWDTQLTRLFDASAVARGEMGFRGVTTNPPLSLQALESDPDFWRAEILKTADRLSSRNIETVYWATYLEIVRRGADMIRPVFEASERQYGFVSGQVDPRLVRQGEAMLDQGLDLAAQGPNVMVKIPGSKEGYEVIEELTARGIPTNNTTSFTVPQYMRCMAAVTAGLQRARATGVDLSRWRSVITHMSSRLGQLGDWQAQAKDRGIDLSVSELRDGEEAVLKRAYHWGRENTHPSKMLQCSMRIETDDRTGRTVSRHIEDYAGGDFVYTCPPSYIAGLMQAEDELADFDANAIDRPPNPDSLAKLMKLPAFRAAYEFDGMAPAGFADYGAFMATATQFAAATRRTVDFVQHALEAS